MFIKQETFLKRFKKLIKDKNNIIQLKNDEKILNVACAYDTEASTWASCDDKVITAKQYSMLPDDEREKYIIHGYCYLWQFGVKGVGITKGRTLEDYEEFTKKLKTILKDIKLIVYVHNLSYEFNWFRLHFNWENVFCVDQRKPIKAEDDQGIIYKCSYYLTGHGLAYLGEQIGIKKLTGELDYDLIRHSKTKLTPQELKYAEHDIKILLEYIDIQIKKEKNIKEIPLTKTGYVRRDVREYVLGNNEYKNIIKRLTLKPDEYMMAKSAFAGGFTHAGRYNCNKKLENVGSWDITSSYPAVMLADYYPMSRGRKINISKTTQEQLKKYLKTKCCIFSIQWATIEAKYPYDNYLSLSKIKCDNYVDNNGRIMWAEKVSTIITEIDYDIIKATYNTEGEIITSMYIYDRGYLPKPLIEKMLEYYYKKTALKDIPDKEEEYIENKEYINSMYGMMVTDIVRDIYTYTDKYEKLEANINKAIARYNYNPNRFTSYLWGLYITCHARRNLWHMIIKTGKDYVYSDTDSVKFLNPEKHRAEFEEFNNHIKEKMEKALKYHGIDINAYRPKNKEGKEKPLGYYHDEGIYKFFKTIGAKKYITESQNGEIVITIAGVGKKDGSKFFAEQPDPFEAFQDDLYINAENCGKTGARYIDHEDSGIITDYQGNTQPWKSKTAVGIVPVGYSMSITELYQNILMGVIDTDLGINIYGMDNYNLSL